MQRDKRGLNRNAAASDGSYCLRDGNGGREMASECYVNGFVDAVVL